MTPEELLPKLEALRNDAVDARNHLRGAYPTLPAEDPRIVTARHIKAAVGSTYFAVIHIHENLHEERWWHAQGFGAAVDAGTVPDELADYLTFVTAGFIVFPFSLFESGMRRLVRAIDPVACSGGTAPFKNVYDWLLARLAGNGWTYPNATEFLDLYRHVRNTLHNNGQFFSPNHPSVTVIWKGTSYAFKHASAPGFMDWDLDLELVGELVELNRELMQSPQVAALAAVPVGTTRRCLRPPPDRGLAARAHRA